MSGQARAGRDIPLDLFGREVRVVITEGAVRAIIRSAGDQIPGLVVGRISLIGDVTLPGEPVTIDVDATVMWGQSIPDSAEQLKRAIDKEVRKHTYLNITSIGVTVHDIHQDES